MPNSEGQFEPGLSQESKEISPESVEESKPEKGEEDEPLTAEKASKLLFLSYRFSQGLPSLQKNIFRYIKVCHPEWRIDDALKEQIYERSEKIFIDYMKIAKGKGHASVAAGGADIDEEVIKKDLSRELNEMSHIFSKGAEDVDETLKHRVREDIAIGLITRDYEFLSREKGRPRSSDEQQGKGVHADPFLSHLCYYGIEGHKTGSEEYDQMFSDVIGYIRTVKATQRGEIESLPLLERELPKLDEVIERYNETHPETEVSL